MFYSALLFIALNCFLVNVSSRAPHLQSKSNEQEKKEYTERMVKLEKLMFPCLCDGPQCKDGSHCKYGFYENRCGNIICYQGPGAECNRETLCHQSLSCSCKRCIGTLPETKEEFYNPSRADCSQDYGETQIWLRNSAY